MGNRLSKITTRTGDDGTTGLGDGSRTRKDALRVQAMGDVDELNSQIGVLLCEDMPADLREELVTIQHDLSEFILPGGSRAAALTHVCRTVCRRAERAIVALGHEETLNPQPRQYVNRLSDLMFVLARVLNRYAGGSDVLWEKGRNASQ
jgi:cob(I)alamin adenosyltransferase